jgi:hypothetical protein
MTSSNVRAPAASFTSTSGQRVAGIANANLGFTSTNGQRVAGIANANLGSSGRSFGGKSSVGLGKGGARRHRSVFLLLGSIWAMWVWVRASADLRARKVLRDNIMAISGFLDPLWYSVCRLLTRGRAARNDVRYVTPS